MINRNKGATLLAVIMSFVFAHFHYAVADVFNDDLFRHRRAYNNDEKSISKDEINNQRHLEELKKHLNNINVLNRFSTALVDLTPLLGTEWEVTYTIVSTFTDRLRFDTKVQLLGDSEYLDVWDEHGDNGSCFPKTLDFQRYDYTVVFHDSTPFATFRAEFYDFDIVGGQLIGIYKWKDWKDDYSGEYHFVGEPYTPPDPPTVDFFADTLSGYAPLTVSFTSITTGQVASYAWNFGSFGANSSEPNPTYTFKGRGSYGITLTVTGPGGSDMETKIGYITVLEEPSANLPKNGIWKSHDDVLAMYLQKFLAGSCVIVITMGDGTYTSFLDSSFSDGVYCSNDLDNQGHTISLTFSDSTHGSLTVTLPGWGEVSTPVECKFPDIQ